MNAQQKAALLARSQKVVNPVVIQLKMSDSVSYRNGFMITSDFIVPIFFPSAPIYRYHLTLFTNTFPTVE